MKNFDNQAYKSQYNHNFYTQTYYYLRQSIHTFLDKVVQNEIYLLSFLSNTKLLI